jgi:hypothetical protein
MKTEVIKVTDFSTNDHNFRTFTNPKVRAEVYVMSPTNALQRVASVKIGDTVEYDSMWVSSDGPVEGYKHSFLGQVTSIGTKTVTVQPEDGGKSRRLKLHDFWIRNWEGSSIILVS